MVELNDINQTTPAQALRDMIVTAADVAWACKIIREKLLGDEPPKSRYAAIVCTKLEEAEMWAERDGSK